MQRKRQFHRWTLGDEMSFAAAQDPALITPCSLFQFHHDSGASACIATFYAKLQLLCHFPLPPPPLSPLSQLVPTPGYFCRLLLLQLRFLSRGIEVHQVDTVWCRLLCRILRLNNFTGCDFRPHFLISHSQTETSLPDPTCLRSRQRGHIIQNMKFMSKNARLAVGC